MNRNRMVTIALALSVLLIGGLQVVHAGPPLVCHPIQIGNARSLPGGGGPFGTLASYDRTKLIEDVLDLLKPDMPVLVRMETLRRATLYASGIYQRNNKWSSQTDEDRRLAYELLSRLEARALQENGDELKGAMATFDVGYLMACYEQANITKNLPGYELVKKSLTANNQNPELEFACALITTWPKNPAHSQHLQRARAASSGNSLLAANIEAHFGTTKAQ